MLIEMTELLKLEEFRDFKFLNKKKALQGFIRKTGILDYESKEMVLETFGENELVITTLLAYKNDLASFFEILKELVYKGGALGIKKIYFDTLPNYMIEFCDEYDYPVFTFQETYFEDIVTIVDRVVKNGEINQLLVDKVNLILHGEYSRDRVRSIARKMNRNFSKTYRVYACKKKQNISKILNKGIETLGVTIIDYEDIRLVIYSKENLYDYMDHGHVLAYLRTIGFDTEAYQIGIGSLYGDLGDLNYAINEAIAALKYCTVYNEDITFFENMGIDRYLIPNENNVWCKKYSGNIISSILENNKNNMIDTVKAYVLYGGDIKKVAKEMYQHENTIRYRLEKLKEIMEFDGTDMEFFTELSIAIKIYMIKNIGDL